MKMNFNIKKEEVEIKVGDIVILENEIPFLICSDYDGQDYRALNLKDLTVTEDYWIDLDDLLLEIKRKYDCSILRIIKGENVELNEVLK